MSTEITVPTLGESVSEATVAQWLKKPGEAVEKDEAVVELETDKVTLEVNAPEAGTLEDIQAEEGDTVEVGAVLGSVGAGDGKAAKSKEGGSKKKQEDAKADEAEDEDKDKEAKADKQEGEDEVGGGDEAQGGESVDVTVPSLGESVTEADIAQWLKQEGDQVERDEPIAELETEKATLEVNAPAAGVLEDLQAKAGETVEVGALIARVRAGGTGGKSTGEKSAGAKGEAKKEDKSAEAEGKEPSKQAEAEQGDAEAIAMPAAAKLMREHGLEPKNVRGTGKDGRITKEDAMRAIDAGGARATSSGGSPGSATSIELPSFERPESPPRPQKDREERVRMSKLRQTIAKRLKDAQNTAAMLTTFNEVDMSALIAVRNEYRDPFEKKHGVRLGFMSFFVKACVAALKELPGVNAEIDGSDVIYKNYYDVGVAVSTPNGLVVPVIRDADQLSLAEIEKSINELGKKGRDGKLSMAELTGGTFTISNGGVFGSLMSTPILNPPQSGILGMHKIQQRPMAIDGKVEIRPMMYLAMSYDHRIVDGKEAVTFLVRVKDAIEDPQRLLLDV
jgi:2-oxoglutarate dehydrogenase E2 component (dihydrolipoamide succinyltransferase)